MPTTSLRALARYLDVPERTLRRAAAEGLIHGKRTSPRRFETSLREEAYLREHWPLLKTLRAGLRTEPNVRLAVLFGSLATGRAHPGSDVDLLVSMGDPSAERVAELTSRLEQRLARPVQVVRLEDAEATPLLTSDAVERGRVLVDRDRSWPSMVSNHPALQREAAEAEPPLLDSMESLADEDRR